MLKGYDIAKELVEKLYKDNQVFVTGVFDEGVKAAKPSQSQRRKSFHQRENTPKETQMRMNACQRLNLWHLPGVRALSTLE
jgi:hypothetical protein